jgi:hypothetical protein
MISVSIQRPWVPFLFANQPHSVGCSHLWQSKQFVPRYVDLSLKLEELMTSSMRETTREAIQRSTMIRPQSVSNVGVSFEHLRMRLVGGPQTSKEV